MSAISHYTQEFLRIQNKLAGQKINWLNELRQSAIKQFSQQEFPSTNDEDWKYTNIAPILQHNFITTSCDTEKSDLSELSLLGETKDCYRLVFCNGNFQPQLSDITDLPTSVRLKNLTTAIVDESEKLANYLNKIITDDHNFITLNTSFIHDGAYIYLPENTRLEKPIHLIFVNSKEEAPAFNSVRNLLVAEKNSSAAIIETYISAENCTNFTNTITEIVLNENANIEHYKLIQESDQAFHIGTVATKQKSKSNFTNHSFALSGKLIRSDVNVELTEEHAKCSLNGLYVTQGQQHVDHHTTINHAKPNCESHEYYKGILADRSRAVFNGKVIVQPHAIKSLAHQTNKNLLLSKDAEIDTKPQLEIYNDDVQCTHGAAVGQLSEDALFYLQSRGIDKNTATNLLTYAFVKEIIERVTLSDLRTSLQNHILKTLKFQLS